MQGKGAQARYATLPAREMTVVQVAHLRSRFELAERSVVAERAVVLTNQALSAWESEHGPRRLGPGQMLWEAGSKTLVLPLYDAAWVRRLSQGVSVDAVRTHIEFGQVQALLEADPEGTVEDLWRLVAQRRLPLARGRKEASFLPAEPLGEEGLRAVPRRPQGTVTVPGPVAERVVGELVSGYGCRPAQAEGMVRVCAEIRAWCCPAQDELEPGQLVWLCRSTRRTRGLDPRAMVPAVLTLITPQEAEGPMSTRNDLKALKMRQIERITAEAWRQDAVLTTLDLEWLLGIPPTMIRELLEAYQAEFGIVLPTAGTVLDMGRTLTHKALVVELALSGLSTAQISRRIYHTPEAVDAYLRVFDRAAMLRYFGVPEQAMPRITGHSPGLLKEHLELIDKHFPTREALAS
ncbi:MAG: DUF1670 domain-containing protein, partial [Bacillota bacterium]